MAHWRGDRGARTDRHRHVAHRRRHGGPGRGQADSRAARPVRQTDRWFQEEDPAFPEAGRARRKGLRRRRGSADRPQAPRPLRRRRRPQAAGGVDDKPADQDAGSGATENIRSTVVFVKRSAGAPQAFFACEAAGLQWLSTADGGVPCARVLGYDDTSLTLERLNGAAPTRTAAVEFGQRLARTHDAGAEAFGAPPDG